jgi:hypothetical protein
VIVTMAWKSLLAHPVRTAVLGVGFGLGVSVMATLLGVGEVVLQQARSPKLAGGGDLLVTAQSGPVTSGRFVLSRLADDSGIKAASPRRHGELYLIAPGGGVVPVGAQGGIPSLERAIGDPETAEVSGWVDSARDAAWARPEPAAVLRAMDRFRAVPDVPARAASWAEWLYFKGRSGELQFYMTFLAGPTDADGRRTLGVRLQIDRNGRIRTYGGSQTLDEDAIVAAAPDLAIGMSADGAESGASSASSVGRTRASVRLEGLKYLVTFDLPSLEDRGRSRAAGSFVIEAVAGRSLSPIELRGAGGWVSGYTVPVMSGALAGSVVADGETIDLAGTGYHDHNWGFWQGVTWRWGQVQHGGLSYVYGRVIPPEDAADPERLPGFLVALGPEGPVGYATRVTIDETDAAGTNRPARIIVTGRARDLDLRMEIAVESAIVNKGGALAAGPDFLQMRGTYHVTGRAGGQPIDFTESGAAETFREQAP